MIGTGAEKESLRLYQKFNFRQDVPHMLLFFGLKRIEHFNGRMKPFFLLVRVKPGSTPKMLTVDAKSKTREM